MRPLALAMYYNNPRVVTMPRVHPRSSLSFPTSSALPSAPSPYVSSERKVFTIWMKSIVLNGNGCTVFNANGDIIYRIDNYNWKYGHNVYLMDLRGSVLFTILKKKFRLFGRWEGHRRQIGSMLESNKSWFQVRKLCGFGKRALLCEVTVKLNENEPTFYRMDGVASKSACKIVDQAGVLIAEVKQKQTTAGVALGGDVLTMVVEPHIDHSLIMGLIAVYNLINHKM